MGDGSDWAEFWIAQAELNRLPHTYISVLIEYIQAGRKITAGNTFDRIHAGYLVSHDALVTADKAFHEALVFASQHVAVRGQPILIKRASGVSALAELRTALGGQARRAAAKRRGRH